MFQKYLIDQNASGTQALMELECDFEIRTFNVCTLGFNMIEFGQESDENI